MKIFQSGDKIRRISKFNNIFPNNRRIYNVINNTSSTSLGHVRIAEKPFSWNSENFEKVSKNNIFISF